MGKDSKTVDKLPGHILSITEQRMQLNMYIVTLYQLSDDEKYPNGQYKRMWFYLIFWYTGRGNLILEYQKYIQKNGYLPDSKD